MQAFIPCGLPKMAWNVSDGLYRGHSRLNGDNVPNMRAGLRSSFRVDKGPWCVVLSDGSVIR